MKKILLFAFVSISSLLQAQRPATKAEREEDARVLRVLSEAMPHEIDGWLDEGESTYGESKLTGRSGFYNNTNFSTRDIYEHQYTISYRMVTASDDMMNKIQAARDRNDFEYVVAATTCEINVLVNGRDDQYPSGSPFKKINAGIPGGVYRDEAGRECTMVYLGKNWKINTKTETSDDGRGTVKKEYFMNTQLNNKVGTVVQSVQIQIKSNAAVAELFMKQINWEKITALLGTGAIKDDEAVTELKKYFVEKPVPAITGSNTLSFTMVAEDGTEKNVVMTSAKHDLTNCALLRNHNENPKVMQEAHIDFRITDDKNPNLLFHLSLPIIRTTGSVTATYDSDYDYQVMWRGNTDVNHSLQPTTIEIRLTKWSPVGGFLEGTFSGTATMKDHNDFSTQKPSFTIKNGKFRMRRIADEMR